PDVLRAIIVGNEVLLRRELPESELIRYIDRVRQATAVPVTYADVWEFWNQHPALAPAVSFVTIHILPYWEDEPVGIDGSIAHVVDIHRLMQARFPDKALLIGETGWPSAGRARREAVPGRVAQARFVREFTHAAQQHALRYNLIEAFDQPWKRQLEGAMGGAWGLLDRHGELKFPWRGPVAEVPDWHAGPIAAAAGAALFGAIAAFGAGAGPRGGANPRARGRGRHLLAAALAGAALGAVLALQWRYLVTWNRYLLEWTVSTGYTLLALAYAGLALRCLDRRNRVVPAAAETLARIRRRAAVTPLHGLSLLNAAFLFGAATMIVLHVFDGRYRGFPTPLYIVPLAASALLWIAGAARFRGGIEERWLAATIAAGGLLVIALERPSNLQAVGFVAVVIALAAIGSGLLYRRGAGAAARASTSTPSKPPTAAGS
ncbi:MAG TPA: hypothetical protein VM491_00125, partial [Burkholderiaceae bacterium]|nr:hypothetical protein [Burkholderiaceae bacterium]